MFVCFLDSSASKLDLLEVNRHIRSLTELRITVFVFGVIILTATQKKVLNKNSLLITFLL